MVKYMIPALALAFVAACGSDAKDDSGDTGPTTGGGTTTGTTTGPTATLISQVEIPGCGTSTDTWTYWAMTDGWTDGVSNKANVWETAAIGGPYEIWNEEHDLPSVAFTEAPKTDTLQRDLADESGLAGFEENVNTLFACGTHDQGGSNTYVFRVYDEGGNLADCAVVDDSGTGTGAADVFAGVDDVGNPVTAPEEISSANCVEF